MSGLLAVFNPDGVRPSLAGMAARFPSHAAKRDGWEDSHFAALRLHHGVLTRAPQPVWSEDRETCLFMDGELIAAAPAARPAEADGGAATCLELYRAGRLDRFAELDGSFALIVYEPARRNLTLISDRHGTRPLYYFITGGELVVASHIAALTAHPACPRRLNRQALHELLTFRRVFGDSTIYHGVEMLPAATALDFDGREARARRYWQLRWRPPSIGKKEAVAALADGIIRAVRRRLAGGVRAGLLLSGGLDSRVVLAAAEQPPACFAIGLGETAQVDNARRAAALRQAAFHYLQIDADSYWNSFEEAVRLTSGMYGAQHNHFLPVLDAIGRQSDVLLHGWGFGTIYRNHVLPARILRIRSRMIRLPWLRPMNGGDVAAEIASIRTATNQSDVVADILTPEALAEHAGRLRRSIGEVLRDFRPECQTSPYHAWDYTVLRAIGRNTSYPNILSIRSRMDERTAALDHDLFELFLEMPPEWRAPDTVFRAALARLSPALARLDYADTGLPASVNLNLEVPLQLFLEACGVLGLRRGPARSALAGRRSWPNFGNILRQHPAFRARLERLPHSEALLACGLFDVMGLKTLIARHLEGLHDQPKLLLMLLTLDSWIGQFGADGVA